MALAMIAYGYDHWLSNGDNLLYNIAYRNVAELFLVIEGFAFVLYLMLLCRYELVQNVAVSILSCFVCLLLVEVIGHIVLGLQLIESAPSVFRRLYISSDIIRFRPFPAGDLNPVAGRSHLPNGSDHFVNREGDSLRWTYNSVGAKDRGRSFTKKNGSMSAIP